MISIIKFAANKESTVPMFPCGINDRATRTTLKTEEELMRYGKMNKSCSTCDTRRIILIKNQMICYTWAKDQNVVICDTDIP
jgi:hypothetical protein